MNKGLNPFFLAFESHHINAGKIPTSAPANKGIYVRGEIATYWHVHPGDGGDKSPADPSTSASSCHFGEAAAYFQSSIIPPMALQVLFQSTF